MLTSETPWKAKNEKELIKKIENDKIEDILSKKNLSPMSKDFIMLSLRLERSARMCPEDVARFDFSKVGTGSILMEKKLNTSMKPVKPEGHQSLTSPKAHFEKSVENKEVYDRRSSAHKGDQSENYQLRVHKNASVTAC